MSSVVLCQYQVAGSVGSVAHISNVVQRGNSIRPRALTSVPIGATDFTMMQVQSPISFRVQCDALSGAINCGGIQLNGGGWCSLCGNGGGWMKCGRCMGEGGFSTRPGLAGVKGKVGWARCKTCFGHTVVPCLICGIPDVAKWKQWLQHARQHPSQRFQKPPLSHP